MASVYTSVLKDNVLDPFESLLKSEFGKIPIHYDLEFKHRGNFFIRVIPTQDLLDEFTTEDQIRTYGLLLRVYRRTPGPYSKEQSLTQLINYIDRIKRLIGNNSNYRPDSDYAWNDGVITRVNYQPDLEDKEQLYQVADLLFNCNVLV